MAKHDVCVYEDATERMLFSAAIHPSKMADIKRLVPPDADDPDMVYCYAVPMGSLVEVLSAVGIRLERGRLPPWSFYVECSED